MDAYIVANPDRMRLAAALLGNQFGPDTLPSGAARAALLGAVARHESRLTALQQQAEGALRRGEAEAEEALEAAILSLDAGLSDATRALATDLDELTAICEDSIIQSTAAPGSPAAAAAAAAAAASEGAATTSALEEMVALARQQLRVLPSSVGAASSSCVDAMLSATCEVDALVDGCSLSDAIWGPPAPLGRRERGGWKRGGRRARPSRDLRDGTRSRIERRHRRDRSRDAEAKFSRGRVFRVSLMMRNAEKSVKIL